MPGPPKLASPRRRARRSRRSRRPCATGRASGRARQARGRGLRQARPGRLPAPSSKSSSGGIVDRVVAARADGERLCGPAVEERPHRRAPRNGRPPRAWRASPGRRSVERPRRMGSAKRGGSVRLGALLRRRLRRRRLGLRCRPRRRRLRGRGGAAGAGPACCGCWQPCFCFSSSLLPGMIRALTRLPGAVSTLATPVLRS